jgi:hypothetical protein
MYAKCCDDLVNPERSITAVLRGMGSSVISRGGHADHRILAQRQPGHAEIRLLSVDPGQAGAIVRIITQFFCPFDRW